MLSRIEPLNRADSWSTTPFWRRALPNDYLEKIFQVPFWVDDLTNAARASIVRGLLSGHVTSDAAGGNNGQENGVVRLTPETLRVLTEMVAPRTSPLRPDVTALQVRREELEFLERLTPPMGRTPRSVKRFVNLYQLMKVLRLGRAHGEIQQTPSDEYLAAFLLAVAEGLPTVGVALMRERVKFDPPTSTLQAFIQSQTPGNEEVVRLTTWLAQPEQGSAWQALELSRLVSVADDVQRFLFRRVELTRPDGATAFRPQLVHIVQDR
jgi:hypothetical protein